jgi:Fe-S-cluster containining protein
MVDLVRQGPFLLLQFNMECKEAPCQAMCCRMRPQFSVPVTEDEASWMQTVKMGERAVLAGTDTGDCVYLIDSLCSIYERRPEACRNWHCSPQGGLLDPEITKRDAGWALIPARSA